MKSISGRNFFKLGICMPSLRLQAAAQGIARRQARQSKPHNYQRQRSFETVLLVGWQKLRAEWWRFLVGRARWASRAPPDNLCLPSSRDPTGKEAGYLASRS